MRKNSVTPTSSRWAYGRAHVSGDTAPAVISAWVERTAMAASARRESTSGKRSGRRAAMGGILAPR
jgi:hypothetical protein